MPCQRTRLASWASAFGCAERVRSEIAAVASVARADTLARMNHVHSTALVALAGLFLVVAVALAGLCLVVAVALAADPPARSEPSGNARRGELFHVVSLKFKPGATPEQIGLVEKSFEGLKETIPGIKSLKWGTNVSPEKHDKG